MTFDYRAEMKRPALLVLAALAVVGWILAVVVAIHQARESGERRPRGHIGAASFPSEYREDPRHDLGKNFLS